MVTRQTNIKNKIYYFFNDLIWLHDFDANMLKIDKKNHWILLCIILAMLQKKPEYNIDSVNPLYLIIKEL